MKYKCKKRSSTLFLCAVASLFISAVGFPPAYTFPSNIKQLKGSIRFMAAYNYAIKKDSTGKQIAAMVDKSYISFHPSGNSIVSECYGGSGRPTEYYCRYDSLGRMAEMDIMLDLLYFTRYIHQYDEQNREIETKSYISSPVPCETETFTYPKGEARVLIKTVQSSLNHIDTSIASSYYDSLRIDWNNGRRHDESADFQYTNKGVAIRNISTLNENNDVTVQKRYAGNSLIKIIAHHYIYDSVRNWTSDSIFYDNVFSNMITRRIYYE